MIAFGCFYVYAFTDLELDLKMQYHYGWWMFGIITIFLVINLAIIVCLQKTI